MKYEEYQKIYAAALLLDDDFETIKLPIEVKDGETQDEALLNFLLEQGFIETKGKDLWRIKDRSKIEEYNPNLLKFLDTIIMSTIYSELDEQIDAGLVYMTVDEDGNILYELTEKGKKENTEDWTYE
jgi:hypothetical protein